MAPSASETSGRRPISRLAHQLHRFFLPLLVAVYGLAVLAPRPGAAIREFSFDLPGGGRERASMLLLAVLLFCAAAVIEWSQLAEVIHKPSTLLAGLAAVWVGPVLLVMVTATLLPRLVGLEMSTGVLVGLAIVAAMPVANSSAGWTQNAGGNVALSLGLIVLSILVSPLATPSLLKFMGLVLSPDDTARITKVVSQFSGWRFILWVILPSLAGGAFAWIVGHARIVRLKPLFRIITLVDILVLNYANASLTVDRAWGIQAAGHILLAASLAVLVSVVGISLAGVLASFARLSMQTWIAMVFGLSMKHTGLALVVASEILHDQPRVVLIILLTTLAQHVAAAVMDRRIQRLAALAVEPRR